MKNRYESLAKYILTAPDGLWTLLTDVLFPQFTFYPEHRRMLYDLWDARAYVCLGARGSGKTVLGTAIRVYRMLHYPLARQGLCSDTERQAAMILDQVRHQWENNKKLNAIFPGVFDAERSKHLELWTIARRDSMQTEPTVWGAGLTGQWTQKHFEFLDLDDIVDNENSQTRAQRDALRYRLATTIYPTLVDWKKSQRLYYGTRYHVADEYHRLMRQGLPGNDYAHDIYNEQGKSRYPAILSDEFLADKKQALGSAIFACQYQMNPHNTGGYMIKPEWIRTYDESVPVDIEYSILSVDIAAGKSEAADYTVMTVIGKGKDGCYYIMDMLRGRWDSLRESAMLGQQLIDRHRLLKIAVIEDVMTLKLGVQYYREQWDLPVKGVGKQHNKIYYVNMVLPFFESGQVLVNQRLTEAVDELLLFPRGEHDDIVDTITQGILYLRAGKRSKHSEYVSPARVNVFSC